MWPGEASAISEYIYIYIYIYNVCSRKTYWRCTCILNSDFFPRAFSYLLLQSLVKGGRPKAALVGSRSTEHWSWAGGRRPPLPMLDRLLHLRFQAPWLRPILSSDRSPHQLIARGFQMTLLHQARHINPMQVLLGPAFGGP